MQPSDLLIFLTVLIVTLLLLRVLTGSNRRAMKKRIARIKQRKSGVVRASPEMSLKRKTEEAKGFTYWLSRPLPNFKRLGERLERAGKKTTPRQYLLKRILTLLFITLIISGLFHKPLLLGLCVGFILGVWLPLKWLQRAINKENKKFLTLFPNAIDMIVRGLRSGLPVSESMTLVVAEIPAPVSTVFSEISNTMKLGVTMEKAMQDMARKLDMTEFNFFTTSIILQRETGGNLSEILNNLSEVLRGRFMMRMKIRAISSEARASAYIIASLPFVVLAFIAVASPDYLVPLYNDYRGQKWSAIAAVMMGGGLWVMRRMTLFEI